MYQIKAKDLCQFQMVQERFCSFDNFWVKKNKGIKGMVVTGSKRDQAKQKLSLFYGHLWRINMYESYYDNKLGIT